jgi:ankyrin repeat protein
MDSPIFRLAASGLYQKDSLCLLLDDLNATSPYESTPLHYAVLGGNEDTVRYLVEKGARVNAKNIFQESALHWACKEGNPNVVRYLLQHSASFLALDSEGNTPMHWAAEHDQEEIIRILLDHGDETSSRIKNEDGRTPRGLAERNKSKEALMALRKTKGSPRARKGKTEK